jgi:hypothetical protein
MEYSELFQTLKDKINYEDDCISIDAHTNVFNETFVSKNFQILPGEDEYVCKLHHTVTHDAYNFENPIGSINEYLDLHDSEVKENQEFRYHIFKPVGVDKATDFILLLHGFNEKYWHKYLPWAQRMMEQTGKTVVLFPLAFHMNRAPRQWSDRRLMYQVSEMRKKMYPDIICPSLSNVAISTRLQAKPQRFVWSGLQTYYDVIQLMHQIRAGKHPHIDSGAGVDICSYSIGSLLSQVLIMSNPENFFDKSRLCTFCGGAVFNRMSPVSKFILDSEANVFLYSFVIEHLESHLKHDDRLRHYLGECHPEGMSFLSMLNYKTMRPFRDEKFRALSSRILAITLEKDTVIPPYEVMNTLQGAARDIPVRVEKLDFPFDYKHEEPFPLTKTDQAAITQSFEEVFAMVSEFLK